MCDVLDVSRSTYYDSQNKTTSKREQENIERTEEFIKIHKDSHQRYGAAKIHYQLKKADYTVSINRVQRLMREAGIRSIFPKILYC